MRRAPESHDIVSGAARATFEAATSVIGFSLLPFAPREAEIAEQGREHQERDHRDRDRRTLAELAAGDPALERQGREQVGRVDRATAGDGVDQLEIGESEDDRERHHDRQDRHHHREGDVAKALPGGGAVEHRRLIERGRDGLQARQQRDRDERDAAPDIGCDQREPRRPGRAEEIDIAVAQMQHVDQEIGDDRELRIVDPPECQRGQHRRHDPRQQHDGADQALEREVVVEQQRQPEADAELRGEQAECIGPVSYTHLDVYKRQGSGTGARVCACIGTRAHARAGTAAGAL